jgi:hypothetical protein
MLATSSELREPQPVLFSMLAVPMLVEPALLWTTMELTTNFGIHLVAFDNTSEAISGNQKRRSCST